jgi:hypothetical protein
MASSRMSHAAGLSTKSTANPATELKLLEKKKEFDAVSALEKATTLLLQRIEGLGEDCDIMADSAQGKYLNCFTMRQAVDFLVWMSVHGQVLEQWPKMFEILNLFCESGLSLCATSFLKSKASGFPRTTCVKRIQL